MDTRPWGKLRKTKQNQGQLKNKEMYSFYPERAAREDRRPRQRGADERAWDEQGGLRTVISLKPGGEQLKF